MIRVRVKFRFRVRVRAKVWFRVKTIDRFGVRLRRMTLCNL
jgi:hypothetical protein